MTTTFSGYLGLGTGTSTFTEQTGTGYARQAVTFQNVGLHRTTNSGAATFSATGSNWGSTTQYAFFATASGGSPLFWWCLDIPEAVANGSSLIVAASGLQLFFADVFYASGINTIWKSGDVVGHDNANSVLTVGSSFSSVSGAIPGGTVQLGLGSKIGYLLSANLFTTGDQTFTMGPGSSYIVDKIVATNASGNVVASGGVYNVAAKGGTAIVANSQSYSTLTEAHKFLDLTVASYATTNVIQGPLIFALTSVSAANAVVDLHAFGRVVS